jgi:hypothetical protein
MSLTFDSNGYLFPYDSVSITNQQLEEYFIFNEHRLNIYFSFKQLIHALKDLGLTEFEIWIDGSFATLKTRPNDIDIICFINYQWYDIHVKTLSSFRNTFLHVDVYFVKMYPPEHTKHNLSKFDELDWHHFLTKDRKRKPKGLLKMQIIKEDE